MSWAQPQFPFFYIDFEPLFHLKYMNIHIDGFLQSCTYVNYFSFATLGNLVTVLGAEQIYEL